MKLGFRDVEPFLKKIDPKMRAVLVYGPDTGLVQERAAMLGKQVVADLNDPFNAAHLTGEIISEDPARLSDEASAQSLMGGQRLVRVTSAGNDIAPTLKAWLKGEPNPDCVMIIEGGNLGPRDALRKVCEEAPNAAALACYVEDERSLTGLIRDTLRAEGLNIQADAATWFASNIKGDRLRARMEIEKLLVYMWEDPADSANSGSRNVTLDDVRASSGDMGAHSVDDLVYAFGNRDLKQSLGSFSRLLDEGVASMVLIRSIQNHLLRLHGVRVLIDDHGIDLESAMKTLQPPVFFKQADAFKAQLRIYTQPRLRALLRDVNELEAKTKQSGMPVETLIGDFLLRAAA